MSAINTLLLAAGKSSRIASISKGLPKPLIQIGNDPIIFRNLRWLNSFSCVNAVWINLHYQAEILRREIKNFSAQLNHLDLHFIFEEEILGTAGALANVSSQWKPELHSLIIYGDNLFNFDLNDLIETHFSQKHLITVALFDENKNLHTDIAGGKVVMDDKNRILNFAEGAEHTLSPFVNAGVYVLSPEITALIPRDRFYDFGKDFFPRLLSENIVMHGYLINGYCLGLDTPECFDVANDLINQQKV